MGNVVVVVIPDGNCTATRVGIEDVFVVAVTLIEKLSLGEMLTAFGEAVSERDGGGGREAPPEPPHDVSSRINTLTATTRLKYERIEIVKQRSSKPEVMDPYV